MLLAEFFLLHSVNVYKPGDRDTISYLAKIVLESCSVGDRLGRDSILLSVSTFNTFTFVALWVMPGRRWSSRILTNIRQFPYIFIVENKNEDTIEKKLFPGFFSDMLF